MSTVVAVEGLGKVFKIGLLGKRVEAVKAVSFAVEEGEIFGFVGPNGAGKTTTIKMLMGLIRPTTGAARLFGKTVPSPAAMQNVGFLPENPYVYPYLSPREFVELCGALSGLSGKKLRDRAGSVLERVGIAYAADRPVRRLSKGMVQRTGLAAAMVAEPSLLVLDEPMSGLDPVGRKEVRDLIVDEKRAGRTIFFSTHILADVETLCDRVTVMRKGEAVVQGALKDLLRGDVRETDIVLDGADEALEQQMRAAGHGVQRIAGRLVVAVTSEAKVGDTLRAALDGDARVVEVNARRETLEDLFVKRAIGTGDTA